MRSAPSPASAPSASPPPCACMRLGSLQIQAVACEGHISLTYGLTGPKSRKVVCTRLAWSELYRSLACPHRSWTDAQAAGLACVNPFQPTSLWLHAHMGRAALNCCLMPPGQSSRSVAPMRGSSSSTRCLRMPACHARTAAACSTGLIHLHRTPTQPAASRVLSGIGDCRIRREFAGAS